MGGSLLIPHVVLAFSQLAHADCGLLDDALRRAESSIIGLDQVDARDKLSIAESQLGCAWLDEPDRLARMWLLEGALLALSDDDGGAMDAFIAAHAVAPDAWVPALGADMRALYDRAAHVEPAVGTLIAEGVGEDFQIRVDGRATPLPASLRSGLHLVQIGRASVDFAQVIYVTPGVTTRLQPNLPLLPPELPTRADRPPPPPEPRQRDAGVRLDLHVAVGVSGSSGEPLERTTVTPEVLAREPATKIRVPLEAGVGLRAGLFWARASASAGPLPGGRLMYLEDTQISGVPWLAGGHGALGLAAGPLDVGAQGGMLMPGRPGARGVVNVALTNLVRFEVRAGIDQVQGVLEPAGGAYLQVQPTLLPKASNRRRGP